MTETKFKIALNRIDKHIAVSVIYFSFNRKIKYARIHLNELKEIETELPMYRTVDLAKQFELADRLSDVYYKNLMPCVVEIKTAIECLKICLAINDADQSYFEETGWKKTLSKIKKDLNIQTVHLENVEEKITNLRNFLVHFGDPFFQFSTETFKLTVPNYEKIHSKLTVPTTKNGSQEIVGVLEITLKKMEELNEQLISKRYFYKLQDYPYFSQDWIVHDIGN
jgi:hypothetical protein